MIRDLLQLFFPQRCFGCSSLLLQNEELLCGPCRTSLPFTNQHTDPSNAALQKFYGKVKLVHASCMLYYTKNGLVSRLLHQLKYNNQPQISYALGLLYAALLAESFAPENIDYLVVVPLHRKKHQERGYNQVDGFALALSETFNIPLAKNLLTKQAYTPSQTTKRFLDRIQTKATVFQLQPQPCFVGKHFLLLDDILTTGSTLEACAKLLLQIPDSKVSILCLAYTK